MMEFFLFALGCLIGHFATLANDLEKRLEQSEREIARLKEELARKEGGQ